MNDEVRTGGFQEAAASSRENMASRYAFVRLKDASFDSAGTDRVPPFGQWCSVAAPAPMMVAMMMVMDGNEYREAAADADDGNGKDDGGEYLSHDFSELLTTLE